MSKISYKMFIATSKEECQVLMDYWTNLACQIQTCYDSFKSYALLRPDEIDDDLVEEQTKRYTKRISECRENAERWIKYYKMFDDEAEEHAQFLQPL